MDEEPKSIEDVTSTNDCHRCGGDGYEVDYGRVCVHCGGTGYEPRREDKPPGRQQ